MLADEVRSLVRDTLPLGGCSVEEVAHHLGVDRRTVHRHLAQSGETFSSLTDDVRGELAESYLEGNLGRPADIAELLGFSALSAFSRWHKRHFGFTLTERRNGKSLGSRPAPESISRHQAAVLPRPDGGGLIWN